jgi:hypothetical protein
MWGHLTTPFIPPGTAFYMPPKQSSAKKSAGDKKMFQRNRGRTAFSDPVVAFNFELK